jgi:putative membrane protein
MVACRLPLFEVGCPVGAIKMLHELALLGQSRAFEWNWEMHPMGWWGWGIGMMLMMMIFWGVIIVALVAALRWFLGQSQRGNFSDSALEILRQRYARGEINKEEFASKQRDLS